MPVGFWPFVPVLIVGVWHWHNHRKFVADLVHGVAELIEAEHP